MSTRTSEAAPASLEHLNKPEPLGLALIATLPLGWQVNTTPVAHQTNPLVLNGVESLESPMPDVDALAEWLQRLDSKADIALAHAVLGQVLHPHLKSTPVELYVDRLRWIGPPIEGLLEMWLQIHPLAPPLILEAKADGNCAYFMDRDRDTIEALERLIFRHHRRQIRAQRES